MTIGQTTAESWPNSGGMATVIGWIVVDHGQTIVIDRILAKHQHNSDRVVEAIGRTVADNGRMVAEQRRMAAGQWLPMDGDGDGDDDR